MNPQTPTPAGMAAPKTGLDQLAEAVRNAAASPFLPGGVREALPLLVQHLREQQTIITMLVQAVKGCEEAIIELREQARPPCEGCTDVDDGHRFVEKF